ncbi:MAG TPA: hypothetical protein P5280_14125, partial [Cyclobacteriaceae bacterium]|nr:hypothetical protein [Cyclobacteriaceae bacterium]
MRLRVFSIGLLFVLLLGCGPEKKAMKSFRFGRYQNVINYYKSVLAKDPNNAKANFYVAESYRLSNRIKESEPYYAKAKGRDINRDSVVLYYSQALKANGKYDEAKRELEDIVLTTKDEDFKGRIQREIDGLNYINELSQKQSYYRVKSLEAVNTPLSEYSPAYLNGELYFTASRDDSRTYLATGTPFTKLYKARTSGANVDVSTIAPLPDKINTPNVNDGCVTFSPDGRIMIFAKGNTGKRKGNADVDLYMSRYRNGEWEEPRQININQPDSWESTPAFGPDGRTLYFSSNRKGGFGGLDIYTARMDSRGRFSRVRNMGPEINTSGNELFPYVSEANTLYIASDGHPGFGMLDLFEVKRMNGRNVVENLGLPMNS